MPMKRKLYPPDWNAISRRIRERAGWKCEQCGVPDRVYIRRSTTNPERYVVMDVEGGYTMPSGSVLRVDELPMEFDDSDLTFVILTVHHKGVDKPDGKPGDRRDKMDCRDENLAALCPRCHLLADQDLNIPARKATLIRKKREHRKAAGQLELWEES